MTRSAAMATAALTIGAALVAMTTAGTRVMSKEPRFPPLSMAQLSDAQKPLGEAIMKVSSVGLGGPYKP